ncbi:hypothetical protein B0H66DRAFT_98328 [Apodospora peruviana]|uniref:Uncharacterized protein n=1 Tax=Apodospora peruviana TaxID=516989 RepID=A0AAE0IUF7_9PEZI|nr:hypothetical protein B0H66DRAFT_98328 [Apodospora peruviana]
MDTWVFESNSDMPTLAYQGMVREQETAEELIRTANIVPRTGRGQDPTGQQPTAEDIVTQLAEISNRSSDQPNPPDSLRLPSSLEATATEMEDYVFELRSSAMFPIGNLAMFAEQDQLDFISHALQAERQFDDHYEHGTGEPPSMQIYGSSQRPFIRVLCGGGFADALSPDYGNSTISIVLKWYNPGYSYP